MTAMLASALTLSSLCVQCGPEVNPVTTQAIIEIESRGDPLAIHDNHTGKSYNPPNTESALKIASRLLKLGHSLDLGLMQINSAHLKKGIDLVRLFDPCFNIGTGTKILAEFYRKHARKSPQDPADLTLLKALSSYNAGTPYRGKRYVNRILKRSGFNAEDTAPAAPAGFAKIPQSTVAFFRKGGAND